MNWNYYKYIIFVSCKQKIFLNLFAEDIVSHTQCHDGIVIQICSLQYDVCCYQEEDMVVAMLNWCSQVFGLKLENIESIFDNSLNKYVFGFSAY